MILGESVIYVGTKRKNKYWPDILLKRIPHSGCDNTCRLFKTTAIKNS